MPEFSLFHWTLAVIAAVSIGLSKTGFGGVGMIGMVIMAQILPPLQSTGVILPMLIFADLFGVWTFRRTVSWGHVRKLLPLAAVGVVFGWWVMSLVPSDLFAPLIGGVILIMVLLQFRGAGNPRTRPEHPIEGWIAGWLGGVTTMLANAAGPVMTLYLLRARLPKFEFVGTAAWFFFCINLFKVPFSWELGLISGGSLRFNLALLPAIVFGAMLGRFLIRRISQKWFERLLLGLTVPVALHLVFSVFWK